MVDQLLDRFNVHTLMLQQVQNDAGIERAGARSHGQAVDGGEPHGAGDAAAVLDRAHAGAVAEMGDDEPVPRPPLEHVGQNGNNVLVGQPVEPVAPDAFLSEGAPSQRRRGSQR